MWYFLILIAAIAIIFIIKLIKHNTATMFIMTYNHAIDLRKSKEEALLNAINFFRYRQPFNQLSEVDIANILSIGLKLNDPLLLASIFQYCESKRNINILKDYQILEAMLKKEDQRMKS